MSGVGTMVSSGYGFICGAYMPISQFSEGLRTLISFFPGAYGTALLKNHALRGAFAEMEKVGFSEESIDAIKDSIDCNLYFFGTRVTVGTMYLVLGATVAALIGIYVLMNIIKGKKRKI